MISKIKVLLVGLLLASSAFAGVVDKKAALGGFDGFVERMGAGTRELGRGNTGSADTASMPAAYWNPAILGFRENFNYTLNACFNFFFFSCVKINVKRCVSCNNFSCCTDNFPALIANSYTSYKFKFKSV